MAPVTIAAQTIEARKATAIVFVRLSFGSARMFRQSLIGFQSAMAEPPAGAPEGDRQFVEERH